MDATLAIGIFAVCALAFMHETHAKKNKELQNELHKSKKEINNLLSNTKQYNKEIYSLRKEIEEQEKKLNHPLHSQAYKKIELNFLQSFSRDARIFVENFSDRGGMQQYLYNSSSIISAYFFMHGKDVIENDCRNYFEYLRDGKRKWFDSKYKTEVLDGVCVYTVKEEDAENFTPLHSGKFKIKVINDAGELIKEESRQVFID